MTQRSFFLLSICVFLVITKITGQNNYVQKIFRQDSSYTFYYNLSFNETGKLGLANFSWDHHIDFISLNTNGSINHTRRIYPIEDVSFIIPLPPIIYSYEYYANYHIVAYKTGSAELKQVFSGLMVYNENTNQTWARIRGGSLESNASLTVNDHAQLLSSHHIWEGSYDNDESGLGMALFNIETGEELWNKRFQNNNEKKIITYSINQSSNQSFSILGVNTIDSSNDLSTHILKIDDSGIPIKGIRILQDEIDFLKSNTDSSGNIYLCGAIKISDNLNNFGVAGVFQLIIVKLSQNLDFIWAKQLNVEEYSIPAYLYQPVYDITTSQDGNILFSMSTFGNFPVIVGELSTNGELMSYSGYNFLNPRTAVSADKSLYLISPRSNEGSAILAKTKSDGSIDGCPKFPACVSIEDIEITLIEEEWFAEETPVFANGTP